MGWNRPGSFWPYMHAGSFRRRTFGFYGDGEPRQLLVRAVLAWLDHDVGSPGGIPLWGLMQAWRGPMDGVEEGGAGVRGRRVAGVWTDDPTLRNVGSAPRRDRSGWEFGGLGRK